AGLRELGVRSDDTLLVHSSLSSLGWVCGGPVAVVQGLLDALGPDGTLVVPTQTGDLSDPALWQNPPVPREWWDTVRA
ncbi:AAC(3) family N-acetyltransferase, partial [Streptomyces sp. 4F]